MTTVTLGGMTERESRGPRPAPVSSIRLSVIIPVSTDPRLADCLRSLEAQTLDRAAFEVIVVDQAASAGTQGLVEALGFGYARAAGGAYAARLAGTAIARAPVLVFTDSDVIVPPGWLAEIDALFRDDARVAVTGPSASATDGRV